MVPIRCAGHGGAEGLCSEESETASMQTNQDRTDSSQATFPESMGYTFDEADFRVRLVGPRGGR